MAELRSHWKDFQKIWFEHFRTSVQKIQVSLKSDKNDGYCTWSSACIFDDISLSSGGPGRVVGIATGYGLDGPGIESQWGARFSAPVQTGPGAHPASCTMGTGSFPGVKSDRGVTLAPHPLLVPWSWKGRAIPLLPLWAVRPVQRLSACTRVHFTFTSLSSS
jgi:hypothetical protein